MSGKKGGTSVRIHRRTGTESVRTVYIPVLRPPAEHGFSGGFSDFSVPAPPEAYRKLADLIQSRAGGSISAEAVGLRFSPPCIAVSGSGISFADAAEACGAAGRGAAPYGLYAEPAFLFTETMFSSAAAASGGLRAAAAVLFRGRSVLPEDGNFMPAADAGGVFVCTVRPENAEPFPECGLCICGYSSPERFSAVSPMLLRAAASAAFRSAFPDSGALSGGAVLPASCAYCFRFSGQGSGADTGDGNF